MTGLLNTDPTTIYEIAKSCLGKHITLNENVPPELGCAEAISYILKQAGYTLPEGGFAGTYDLYKWLLANFNQRDIPIVGDIIISPTGTSSKQAKHGHVGCLGKYGILSNHSDTGLFLEVFTLQKWQDYYGDLLGFPVYFFRAK